MDVQEYLLSKKHLFSMLEVLTQGEKHISLNNEVNVRVVLDQSCRLYLVEKRDSTFMYLRRCRLD